ncbi:MAG: NADPH:quinone reductase, partial [Microcoleus sp. C1-bin4]|nr:NADPH:quinone reductase [Microcoleus sp. C1-bin4]
MKAAYYEQIGNAKDVLKIGEMDVAELGAGEVLIKV